jgi:tRNA (guanine37-N1)-methyltransferase
VQPLFAILTLFPEALEPYTREACLGLAQAKGLARMLLVDFRDFTRDRHRTVDDRPFGGGPGMVLKPEPVCECVEWLEARHGPFRKFALCPTGRVFDQTLAAELALEERVLLFCGRYEGFDERILEELDMQPLSLGDFVLAGGELAALAVTEAACRLVPGVLGAELSSVQDSFAPRTIESGEPSLDCPHYTRPRVFRGRAVPEVLLSGDHAAIAAWRQRAAWKRTAERRPDLVTNRTTSDAALAAATRPPTSPESLGEPSCT